jgi:hypothetical protein
MWHALAAAALAVLVGLHLALRWRRLHRARASAADHFYEAVREVLEEARFEPTGAVGLPRLSGRFGRFQMQVQPVVDTLALRRLPVLWLLVTLQEPLPLRAKLDLMMRSAGPTTFSNFDLLPTTLSRPAGFPDQAVLRTDDATQAIAPEVLRPHLDVFSDPRAKELLITPNGLRIVWMLAEADRARYGIFRQADFGDVRLEPELLRTLFARLLALRKSILDWQDRTA